LGEANEEARESVLTKDRYKVDEGKKVSDVRGSAEDFAM